MLKSITLLLLGASTTTEAFTATSTSLKIISTSTTALSEHTIDTRKRIEGQGKFLYTNMLGGVNQHHLFVYYIIQTQTTICIFKLNHYMYVYIQTQTTFDLYLTKIV